MANNFVRTSPSRRRLATWRIDQLLRPKDIFALLIASIGHDVGHPGVNNMFMVRNCCHQPICMPSFYSTLNPL
jgi:hypothetical protein